VQLKPGQERAGPLLLPGVRRHGHGGNPPTPLGRQRADLPDERVPVVAGHRDVADQHIRGRPGVSVLERRAFREKPVLRGADRRDDGADAVHDLFAFAARSSFPGQPVGGAFGFSGRAARLAMIVVNSPGSTGFGTCML
jgi:hypothetical protein